MSSLFYIAVIILAIRCHSNLNPGIIFLHVLAACCCFPCYAVYLLFIIISGKVNCF